MGHPDEPAKPPVADTQPGAGLQGGERERPLPLPEGELDQVTGGVVFPYPRPKPNGYTRIIRD